MAEAVGAGGPRAPTAAPGSGGRAGGALVQTTATASGLAVGDRMCRMTTGCVGLRANGFVRLTDFRGLLRGVSLARPKVMSQGRGR